MKSFVLHTDNFVRQKNGTRIGDKKKSKKPAGNWSRAAAAHLPVSAMSSHREYGLFIMAERLSTTPPGLMKITIPILYAIFR